MLASSATDTAMGATRSLLSEFPPNADWQAIADRLYESNRALVERAQVLQSALQEKQQELAVRAVQLRSLEEAQATKTTETEAALQACQARDREQLRAISTLSERLELSQTRTEQLEQECLALQATCREQVERTTCAQKEIQELHARLQQQQQQTVQAQDALERYLTEQGVYNSHSSAWPPPIIGMPEGDRTTAKLTTTTTTAAAVTERMGVKAAPTIALSVEPSDEAYDDGSVIESAPGLNDDADGASPPEFPFDAILDDAILDDVILEDGEVEPLAELSETDWIAPLVQPPSGKKKHKTLATILLPEF